ncbi:MAG: hypothetical protein ACTSU5_15280 [Promethearchaeota archaeon]
MNPRNWPLHSVISFLLATIGVFPTLGTVFISSLATGYTENEIYARIEPGQEVTYNVAGARWPPLLNFYWDATTSRYLNYSVPPNSTAKFTITHVGTQPSSFYDPQTAQVFGDFQIGNLTRFNESADFLGDNFLVFARDFHGSFVVPLLWARFDGIVLDIGGTASSQVEEVAGRRFRVHEYEWSDDIQTFHAKFDEFTGILLYLNSSIVVNEFVHFKFQFLNTTIPLVAPGGSDVAGAGVVPLISSAAAVVVALVWRVGRRGKGMPLFK